LVLTGLDVMAEEGFRRLSKKRVGVLANQASVKSDYEHILTAILRHGIEIAAIFGPQHGIHGQTQANMIEWESFLNPKLGLPVYSLYGETRSPQESMLEGLDVLVVDLQDVGTRCYTYLWTAVLAMKACADASLPVILLDRPNPLGGEVIEGPVLEKGFESFVGLFPLPVRHGLTMGEALTMIDSERGLGCRLEVVKMKRWRRDMLFVDTGLPWVMPSPNIPTSETALLYSGMVLLEGTNISEGRGTTVPFQLLGAPWIEPEKLADTLSKAGLQGAVFRPANFIPTWDKHAGELCGGVQIHVTDRVEFRPVRTAAAVIQSVRNLYPGRFEWLQPPYEYETEIMPIDIISGSDLLRKRTGGMLRLKALFKTWREEERGFLDFRRDHLIY